MVINIPTNLRPTSCWQPFNAATGYCKCKKVKVEANNVMKLTAAFAEWANLKHERYLSVQFPVLSTSRDHCVLPYPSTMYCHILTGHCLFSVSRNHMQGTLYKNILTGQYLNGNISNDINIWYKELWKHWMHSAQTSAANWNGIILIQPYFCTILSVLNTAVNLEMDDELQTVDSNPTLCNTLVAPLFRSTVFALNLRKNDTRNTE